MKESLQCLGADENAATSDAQSFQSRLLCVSPSFSDDSFLKMTDNSSPLERESTRPVLGYWAIRGLAQPIRNMFAYLGVDFEDRVYVQGDAPTFSIDEWYVDDFVFFVLIDCV